MSKPQERRRRLALVTQGYENHGGVATVARWLHDALPAAGWDVVVHDMAASATDSTSRRLAAPRSWTRRSLRRPLGAQSYGWHWGANAVEFEPMRYRPRNELTRELSTYDVVQVVAGSPALGRVALRAGVPVVLQAATRARWERAPRLSAMPAGRRAWWRAMTAMVSRAELQTLSAAQGVLVWNPAMKAEVEPHCQGPVCVAFPGIDVRRFRPNEGGWSRGGPLLSLSRLADGRKRLDLVIRAFAEMVERDPDVPDLVLAGQGALPAAERALIRELGLAARISVTSDVDPEDVPKLYQDASLYIQASLEEGFGISVVEAMCSGVPVVTTATAGTRMTVVDGVTGHLVDISKPANIAKDLATACLNALNNGPQMSTEARSHAKQNFSSEAALARFTQLYDTLARNR